MRKEWQFAGEPDLAYCEFEQIERQIAAKEFFSASNLGPLLSEPVEGRAGGSPGFMTIQRQEAQNPDPLLPRVSVVDDDPDLLAFFKALAESGRFVMLAGYSSGQEALAQLPHNQPDLVFMDFRLPDLSGIECTKRLTTILPQLRIVVLTGQPEQSTLLDAFRAGAVGYLLKPCTADETLAVIDEVMKEGVFVGKTALPYLHRIIRRLRQRDPAWNLTEREEQLIACIFEGMSYKEISSRLGIRESTVHTHMDHLFEKMGVHSQDEMIARFLLP
jgi:DNA-binding NarL/FixJ family response regulator